MDMFRDFVDNFTLTKFFSWSCSGAMMVGGVIPYVPQYREIKRTDNADGFSTYVCLALLIANTLRIVFWFGHPFEIPLLLQSIIMNLAMLAMMQLCIRVRNKTQIIPVKPHYFTETPCEDSQITEEQNPLSSSPSPRSYWDFDARYFWEWTDFLSYLEFVATFTAVMGILMYFCLNVSIVVETMGFLAVFTEAMLGTPQFYRNLTKKSTFGMSPPANVVELWDFLPKKWMKIGVTCICTLVASMPDRFSAVLRSHRGVTCYQVTFRQGKKMVFLWTFGDVFKTAYFVIREAPLQFWICGALQVVIDFCILFQVLIYRVTPSPVKMLIKGVQHQS